MSVIGANYYDWEASGTSDARALQVSPGSSTRVSACNYSNDGSFTVSLDLADGSTHQVSIYLLDSDDQGRSETVQVSDATTGTVLSSTDVTSFSGGDYLVYDLAGDVNISFINDPGSLNCTFSGIFFDPGPSSAAAATFAGADISTQGTWTDTYGSDGYSVIGGDTSLPDYATMNIVGTDEYTYSWITGAQALQISPGSDTQVAAVDYSNSGSFSVDLDVTDGNTHEVSLYLLDPDDQGRSETVQVVDPATNAVLSSTSVSSFVEGEYLTYDVSGDVQVRFLNDSGSLNCVLSGVFFDSSGSDTEGTISGQVYNDGNMDEVQDAGETSFAGVVVTATDTSTGQTFTATSNGSGYYTVAHLPVNDIFEVSAPIPGYDMEVADGGGGFTTSTTASAYVPGAPVTTDIPECRSLPAPSQLQATSSEGDEVDLSWTSNSLSEESGFHVYESVNGGAFGTSPVATVDSGVTAASITGLSSSDQYAFRVAAYDDNGDSGFSNVADAAAPPAVTSVSSTAEVDLSGNATVTLAWTPAAGTPSNVTYNLYANSIDVMPTTPYVTGISGTSFVDSEVAPGTTGYFWVTVTNGTAESSGTGSGGVSVPAVYGSIDYIVPIAVQIADTGQLQVASGGTLITPPPFDTSLGTETGESASLSYIDSGFLDAPRGNSQAVCQFGWYTCDASGNMGVGDTGGGLDEFTLVTKLPNYYPAHHNKKITTQALPAPPPNGHYMVDGSICMGGDPAAALTALVGFFDVTYTFE